MALTLRAFPSNRNVTFATPRGSSEMESGRSKALQLDRCKQPISNVPILMKSVAHKLVFLSGDK